MKAKFFFIVFCLVLLISREVKAETWTNMNVPWSTVNSGAAGMAVYGTDLYVGSYNEEQIAAAEVWKFNGTTWTNINGPWTSAYDSATLAVYNFYLYAGLYSMQGATGQVWKYSGLNWTNTNAPWATTINGVQAMAVYGVNLYAGTSKGSVSGNSAQVWKYDGSNWTNTNIPWSSSNIITFSMGVYGGNLYVGSESETAAEVWKYNGTTWANTYGPWDASRDTASSLVSYGGYLYASLYSMSGVQLWRFDGSSWSRVTPIWSSPGWGARLATYGTDLFALDNSMWRYNYTAGDYATWANTNTPATITPDAAIGYNGDLYAGAINASGVGEVWKAVIPYYTVYSSVLSDTGGGISCASNPVEDHTGTVCTMSPLNVYPGYYHVAEICFAGHGQPLNDCVPPSTRIEFPSVISDFDVQVTYATNNIWLSKGNTPQADDSMITAALADAAILNSDMIKVQYGAFSEPGGVTCSAAGTAIPKLSGGWDDESSRNSAAFSMVKAPFTISGTCRVIVDGITLE